MNPSAGRSHAFLMTTLARFEAGASKVQRTSAEPPEAPIGEHGPEVLTCGSACASSGASEASATARRSKALIWF